MVKFITVEETIPARWAALRSGKPREDCYIVQDSLPDSFHTGFEKEGEIIGTASFFPVSHEGQPGKGWQLRMMGVMPEYQGQGIGEAVLLLGIEHLRKDTSIDYLWCNARENAFNFYQKNGFEFISDFFDIPGIGPHKTMIKSLKP
ncbi:MAG: GNAT family N-acetyltransferase [Bacteroidia bacterium]|nr:GNAT family N-acetyltransferase [Bacteroidia bacterium]